MNGLKIKTLENTSTEEIVDTLAESFKGYFVPITSDYDYWKLRFKMARLDKKLSVGVFDGNKLVAFILNCIGDDEGLKTAYNSGTGVIESYRNQKLVDKMYDYILPFLKENDIEKLKLEVITENLRAIKVYERIGFEKVENRTLFLYSGSLENVSEQNVSLNEISKNDSKILKNPKTYYSWEFRDESLVLNDNLKIFEVSEDKSCKGYFILNPANNTIMQIEAQDEDWNSIFAGIKQIAKDIRIINVDEKRLSLIEYFHKIGLKNFINQYEMEKLI